MTGIPTGMDLARAVGPGLGLKTHGSRNVNDDRQGRNRRTRRVIRLIHSDTGAGGGNDRFQERDPPLKKTYFIAQILNLVIGADGRNSVVRKQMGVSSHHMSPPMDIVWCKLPCPENWQGVQAYAGRGHLLIAYHTWDGTLQLGWVILKGTFGDLRSKGIDAWVEELANHVSPDLAAHLRTHRDAAQKPFLLEAVSDRVESWSSPGVLLIGDAAHTMSPVAGQGVNIALRDAIVSANHLVPALLNPSSDQSSLTASLKAIENERLPEIEVGRGGEFRALSPPHRVRDVLQRLGSRPFPAIP